MLKNLNATKKGLITGLVMIGITLGIFYSGQAATSPLQFLVHIAYAGGIVWTIYEFSKSEENTNKFAAFFLQGFKCFIVITLLMVIFTIVFNKMHPEFKEGMVKAYNDEMVKTGNSTPAEILKNIESAKDYYLTMLISGAIFVYLATGAVFTAAASLLFMKRK
jgi:high-affinity K+ transport system ATPase subunit B